MNEDILQNIENPIVRRALEQRCGGFMFNYGDSKKHTDNGYYNEYTCSSNTSGKTYGEVYDDSKYNDWHHDSSMWD